MIVMFSYENKIRMTSIVLKYYTLVKIQCNSLL